MALDQDLLDKATAAAVRLREAERDVLLSKAEYHTAIRRLHLAGGSLREIAQRLSMSHQRVQQIVSGAGGTWWRRIWRTRALRPDATCTWCGRPPSEVAKLIAGPAVYICDGCVAAAERSMQNGTGDGPFGWPARQRLARRCAFCSRRASRTQPLATAQAGAVCGACLQVCREIMNGRAS